MNGIGHAAMMTDPQFRAALAAHGFTLDPATGEVCELGVFAGAFSARARQIGRNIDCYEAEWRQAHPGQEPGAKLRRVWDARAWAEARPDKVVPRDGADLTDHWVRELHDLGYRDAPPASPVAATKDAEAFRARIAFVGDRHQLPAVGRGGVLDLAARWADPDAVLTLDTVRRFADAEYATLSLAMRTGTQPDKVFDRLTERGHVVVHFSETERTAALAGEAAKTGALVVADTREQIADLNAAIRERRVATGQVDDRRALVTQAGERIGVGDRIATRRNDYGLGVANRDTWTVTGIDPDGSLRLVGEHSHRTLPVGYTREHVELAYATTVYGAQGETTQAAYMVLGEHTGAASAYVGMTRGRHANTAHVVAEDIDDARRQWIGTFSRERADLGPAHAAELAAEEASKYATPRPPDPTDYERRMRPREPVPMSRPRDRGPGIGF